MENRRGSGIFLGVVSVATLIVAIIGATFAYFSASVESNETIDVTAYKFDADITVEEVYKTRTDAANVKNLIPMLDANVLKAVNEAGCVDQSNYKACTLLKVTIVNNGQSQITLNGEIRTLLNTDGGDKYFTDLVYQPLTGTAATLNGSEVQTPGTFELTGEIKKLTTVQVAADGEISDKPMVDIDDVTLEAQGSTRPVDPEQPDGETVATDRVEFYAVVYLQDALVDPDGEGPQLPQGTDQSSQMGVSYQGQFVYSTGADGGKITATFSA